MAILLIVILLLLIEAVAVAIALLVYRHYKRRSIKAPSPRRRDIPGQIYEVVDPDTGDVVYVGQSTQVEKRIEHYLQVATSTGLIYVWLAEKIQQGKKPIIRTVALGNNKDELNRLEQDRINMYIASGVNLLNRQVSSPSARLTRYVTFERATD